MALPANFPALVSSCTERFMKEDKLNCAEAVFKALMTECGKPIAFEVLCAATGFGRGMGEAGCTCGALVGGIMAIGILYGRSQDTGPANMECFALSKKLHDLFREQNKATCCRILRKGLAYGTEEQINSCIRRASDAAALAATVIMSNENNCIPI